MVEKHISGKRNKQPAKTFEKQKVGSKATDRVEVDAEVKLPQLRPNGSPANKLQTLDIVKPFDTIEINDSEASANERLIKAFRYTGDFAKMKGRDLEK